MLIIDYISSTYIEQSHRTLIERSKNLIAVEARWDGSSSCTRYYILDRNAVHASKASVRGVICCVDKVVELPIRELLNRVKLWVQGAICIAANAINQRSIAYAPRHVYVTGALYRLIELSTETVTPLGLWERSRHVSNEAAARAIKSMLG